MIYRIFCFFLCRRTASQEEAQGPRAEGEGWGALHGVRGDHTGSGKEAPRHFKMSLEKLKNIFLTHIKCKNNQKERGQL